MFRFCLIISFFFGCFTIQSQECFTVYFDSNKFDLNVNENERLHLWLKDNSLSKIVGIHGFTDEDGSIGFNDTLAQHRVETVFNLIKNQIKIRDDFKTRSFGESFNQSKIKADNRKVIIYYLLEKDISKEDELLGIKKVEAKVDLTKTEIDFPDKLMFENPDGSQNEFKLDKAFMKKVNEAKKGEKLKIDNLNFIINTYIVVPEAKGKMYELLVVLKNNPTLKIEIQGHLCCMSIDRLDLSTQRAKAICGFLIANGIYSERLSYKGFGSTQPIFSLPEKSDEERAANRRVEILIVDN
jgi:outer membrane protein OmpA-like peptidoglycan-associated protein